MTSWKIGNDGRHADGAITGIGRGNAVSWPADIASVLYRSVLVQPFDRPVELLITSDDPNSDVAAALLGRGRQIASFDDNNLLSPDYL